MDIEKLRDLIWATRISRVNAEKRLLNKNNFIQGINIYYSCITIIYSILSTIENNNDLGLVTVFMTISLLVTILYLNSFRYEEHARDYRSNYTKLYKLELELHDINISEERVAQIKNEYCDLLDSSCNHITYDYYCAVAGSKTEYKDKLWKSIKHKYRWGVLWRIVVKIIIVSLPIGIYFIQGVVQ